MTGDFVMSRGGDSRTERETERIESLSVRVCQRSIHEAAVGAIRLSVEVAVVVANLSDGWIAGTSDVHLRELEGCKLWMAVLMAAGTDPREVKAAIDGPWSGRVERILSMSFPTV